MNLNESDVNKIKKLQYNDLLRRYIMKDSLLFANVRGASIELQDDIRTLAFDKIDVGINTDKLKRLKYICEYFMKQKSARRKSYDSEDSNTTINIDKFTRAEDHLKQIEEILK